MTFVINTGNSVREIIGSDVTATPSQLLFNFGGSDNGEILFQEGYHSGSHYYCDQAGSGACLTGETVSPSFYTSGQTVTRSGIQVIGSTPEPGTLVLVGSGLMAAVGGLRHKFAR